MSDALERIRIPYTLQDDPEVPGHVLIRLPGAGHPRPDNIFPLGESNDLLCFGATEEDAAEQALETLALKKHAQEKSAS